MPRSGQISQMVPSNHVAEEWTSGILNPQPLLTQLPDVRDVFQMVTTPVLQVRLHCSISAEEGNDVLREHMNVFNLTLQVYKTIC